MKTGNRDSDWLKVGRLNDQSSSPGRSHSLRLPDRFWGPLILLFNGYQELLGGEGGGGRGS
jgi:hypothetical protein